MTSAMRSGERRVVSSVNRCGAVSVRASNEFSDDHSNPEGRTVCPSSPAISSHGALRRRSPMARHSSVTTASSTRVRSWTSSTTMRSKSSNPRGRWPRLSRRTDSAAAASSGNASSNFAAACRSSRSAMVSRLFAAPSPTPFLPPRIRMYPASVSRGRHLPLGSPAMCVEYGSPGMARPSRTARISACRAFSRVAHTPRSVGLLRVLASACPNAARLRS